MDQPFRPRARRGCRRSETRPTILHLRCGFIPTSVPQSYTSHARSLRGDGPPHRTQQVTVHPSPIRGRHRRARRLRCASCRAGPVPCGGRAVPVRGRPRAQRDDPVQGRGIRPCSQMFRTREAGGRGQHVVVRGIRGMRRQHRRGRAGAGSDTQSRHRHRGPLGAPAGRRRRGQRRGGSAARRVAAASGDRQSDRVAGRPARAEASRSRVR